MAVFVGDQQHTDSASEDLQSDQRPSMLNIDNKQSTSAFSEEQVALLQPFLNISLTGSVPTKPDTFALHLPCTGALSAEVDVTLNINVTSPTPNVTPSILYFKRRKICLKGQSSSSWSPHQAQEGDQAPPEQQKEPRGRFLLPAAGVGGLLLVVGCVTLTACVRERWKGGKIPRPGGSHFSADIKSRSVTTSTLVSPSSQAIYSPSSHSLSPSKEPYNTPTYTIPSTHTYTLPYNTTNSNCYASLSQLPTITHSVPQPLQQQPFGNCLITREKNDTLPLVKNISNNGVSNTLGNYSTLQLPAMSNGCSVIATQYITEAAYGSLERSCDGPEMARNGNAEILVDPQMADLEETYKHFQVLIKTVQANAPINQSAQLCRATQRFAGVKHRALLSISGLCSTHPALLLYTDAGYTNLKLFLHGRTCPLPPGDLQQLALQVAQGLAHLHSCNIRHGDLAARNCLVTQQMRVLVSDGALSADLYTGDYTQDPLSGSVRPFAWMSLEALADQGASLPADVWSWGVLAWELSTLAQQPYRDLAPEHLASYLRDGYRLAQPATCPDVLYQLMAFCWAINPQHRPRAALLVDYLAGLDQAVSTNSTILETESSNQQGLKSSNYNICGIDSVSDTSTSESESHRPVITNRVPPKPITSVGVCDQTNKKNSHGLCSSSHKSGITSESPNRDNFNPSTLQTPEQVIDEYSNIGQSSSVYSTPHIATTESVVPPGLSHFSTNVYSTPTSLIEDLHWKFPSKVQDSASSNKITTQNRSAVANASICSKPLPKLPPANNPQSGIKAQRPKLPLPGKSLVL